MGQYLSPTGDIYTNNTSLPTPNDSSNQSYFKVKLRTLVGILLVLITIPSLVFAQQVQQSQVSKPEEDWTKCSIKQNGQAGTLNLSAQSMKNYTESNDRNDPKTLFGEYHVSTDPQDPFFTEKNANGEGRWAGNTRRDTGTPYWHGGPFRRDETAPGANPSIAIKVGGFYYLNYQDKHRFDINGHPNAESNWNRVMRWTEDIMSGAGDGRGGWYKDNNPQLDPQGRWLDRNCVLNTQIFRLWNEYKANNNPGFGFDRESGFYVGAEGIKSVADVFPAAAAQSPATTPVTESLTMHSVSVSPTATGGNDLSRAVGGQVVHTPTLSPTPTATPTPSAVPTATPTVTKFVTYQNVLPVTPVPTQTQSSVQTDSLQVTSSQQTPALDNNGNTTLTGSIGKNSQGNYFAPSAVVMNGELFVFVVGDGGRISEKPQADWYNAFMTSTTDGTTWSEYTNLSGNFSAPLKTNILNSGAREYLYLLGTGTDNFTYFTSTNNENMLHSLWDRVNPQNIYSATAKTYQTVSFKGSTYSFTTQSGQLQICKDQLVCR